MCAKNLKKIDQQFEEEKRRFQNKRMNQILQIIKYAETKYSIEFPEGFAKKMFYRADRTKLPSRKSVDAIIAEWKIWEPYVTSESFNQFVVHELESIFMIQTTSTFHAESLIGYIGNKATVIAKLPVPLSTTVTIGGTLRRNGYEEVKF